MRRMRSFGITCEAKTELGDCAEAFRQEIEVDKWSRRTDIFGADADVFPPARFLAGDTSAETLAQRVKTTDLLFGYGRYTCPGRELAWMEIGKVFVEVRMPFLSCSWLKILQISGR